MKKILFGIAVFLISIFCITNVNAAENFSEGEWIPGIYIKKEKNGISKYQQSRFIIRKSDNHFVYCIEPWVQFDRNQYYDEFEYVTNLSNEQLQNISLIAYYGYGYKNHTQDKWYSITQVMIQKEADKNGEVYFTDKLNGNKIERFTDEINEINNLIKTHKKKIKFNKTNINLIKGGNITLKDYNNVLENYNLEYNSNNFKVTKSDNELTIEAIDDGNTEINLVKKDTIYNSLPIVYKLDNYQNLISVGKFPEINTKIKVNAHSGDIHINKIDQDTKLCQSIGEANLANTTFDLYNSGDKLISSAKVDENCNITFSGLSYGNYYLKESKAGKGYKKNEQKYEISLTNDNISQNLTIANEVYKSKITIHKKYGNKILNNFIDEEGITFNIINNKNEIIDSITTDKNGLATAILPYGEYIIKQVNSKGNYEKIADFKIVVNEKTLPSLEYELNNNEKTGNIRILKIDPKTGKLIVNNKASFKIVNLDTSEYLINKDGSNIFKTNKHGYIEIENLSFGHYQIIETNPPKGYNITNEKITFEINDENYKNSQQIIVSNEKIILPVTGVEKRYNPIILELFIILSFILSTIIFIKKYKLKNY